MNRGFLGFSGLRHQGDELQVVSVRNAPNMSFIGDDWSKYSLLRLYLSKIKTSSDGADLTFQCSTNRGASFDSSTIYQDSLMIPGSAQGHSSQGNIWITYDAISTRLGNNAIGGVVIEQLDGFINIHTPGDTEGYKQFDYQIGYHVTTGSKAALIGSGEYGSLLPINGIRLTLSGGALITGVGVLVGIQRLGSGLRKRKL